MDFEIYRSANKHSAGFDRYTELCRDCAKEEKEAGFHVEYDLYLSERTDVITESDNCEKCGESLECKNPENWERLEGVIY